MIEEILLLSGNDIPLFSANISIHQPVIKEIAYIGEENFFIGCQLLNFSKEILNEEDRNNLTDIDNFDILMSIINTEEASVQKICITMVLSLLFPERIIEIKQDGFYLTTEENLSIINKENFEEFRMIIEKMFSLEKPKEEYKPANEAARKIAEKLKKGREKAVEMKNQGQKGLSIFSRYISILAVGLKMDINVFFNYTVYQLFDEFKRYQLYQAFDINLRARMAGATGLDEIDNWMDNIHF